MKNESSPLSSSAKTQPYRVLITGGGTGGHVYPGLAVAEALGVMASDVEIRFAGTKRGLEATLVPRAGYYLFVLPASGFRGLGLGARVAFVGNMARGVLGALYVFLRWRPAIVLGTGGYVCAPSLVAARLLGIPCALQEQNAVPGSANRLLGRWVKRIYLGFASARSFFRPGLCRTTGNPVRMAVVESFSSPDLKSVSVSPAQRVLIFGGSRGARTLNRAVMAASEVWAQNPEVGFLIQTGPEAFKEVQECCRFAKNLEVVPYIEDMATELKRATLVVCRAGAMTLAEIQCAGKPAVLVPYPHATDDHQLHNAQDCATAGAAVVLPDGDCRAERLIPMVDELLRDGAKLIRMGQAARSLAKPGAARVIAADLLAEIGHPAGVPCGHEATVTGNSNPKEGNVVR